jgi:uncharacterized protein YjbJ (UPF0337 family)
MTKNQVSGIAKDLTGKLQETAGKIIGNPTQEAKGVKKQAEGQLEEKLGDAKKGLKDARDTAKSALKSS